MNANEYIQQLIEENNNQPSFDNLRHVAQNVSTVCGVSIEEAFAIVEAHAIEIESAGLVAG